MDWWLTHGAREPIGPVSTELILKGIGAGMIPKDSLVCEVGGTEWRPIRKTAPFSLALANPVRGNGEDERTLADAPGDEESLSRFDEVVERTVVDIRPPNSSIPPPMRRPRHMEYVEEKTLTDEPLVLPSEPPEE
jgi:hypothetical protein